MILFICDYGVAASEQPGSPDSSSPPSSPKPTTTNTSSANTRTTRTPTSNASPPSDSSSWDCWQAQDRRWPSWDWRTVEYWPSDPSLRSLVTTVTVIGATMLTITQKLVNWIPETPRIIEISNNALPRNIAFDSYLLVTLLVPFIVFLLSSRKSLKGRIESLLYFAVGVLIGCFVDYMGFSDIQQALNYFRYNRKWTGDVFVRGSLQMYSAKNELDIIVFPEMSFTGYNFQSFQDALPLAVVQEQGTQFQFGRELAIRTRAYVAFGFQKAQEGAETALYNSAAVLDHNGKLVCNYCKSNLYYNHKLCKGGTNFTFFALVTRENRSISYGVAICADIMPKDFTFGDWELDDYLVKTGCEALVFMTNWVDSETDEVTNSHIAATYSYWIHRLQPVVVAKKAFLLLIADSVGIEYDYFAKKETMFYGSSAVMMFNSSKVLKNLDIKNEGYLLIDTYLP